MCEAMLGLSKSGNQTVIEAVVTFALILAVNVLNLLPEKAIPTTLDLYVALRQGFFTSLTIYLLNKGIEWRKSKAEQPTETKKET